jgi:hypothetical protein
MPSSLTTSLSADMPRGALADAPRALPRRRVLQVAGAMVLAQLAFRAWATYSSWYTYDDFLFISRMSNDGLQRIGEPYAGHVMPGGFVLSWLADELAPFDFRVTGTMLLLFQLLADVGLVVMLVRLFGARAGILPPLAVYLFCVISVPVAIWWAAGVNQLPLQVALFWSTASHVQYLRTRRLRHLTTTVAWLVLGLLFYEKTLLVLGALAIVTLAWFTTGDARSRARTVWRDYRAAAVAFVAMGLAYLAAYATLALNFSPGGVNDDSLGGVVSNMVVQGYTPAILGGPLRWTSVPGDQFSLANPGNLFELLSLTLVVLLVREINLRRTNSLRAWLLPAFFLLCDVLLVVAGRASFVGALIALDFRYQGEMPAVTALALACATMPILGSRAPVDVRPTTPDRTVVVDLPRRVAAATAVVSVLGLVSSAQYVWHWKTTMPAEPYFARLLGGLERAPEPVPLIDAAVPNFVMLPLGYPENLLSHLLVHYRADTDFSVIATDHLNLVDDSGRITPVQVDEVRRAQPGPREGCGYAVRRKTRTIPLTGPLAFGGWWVRVGYLSSGQSPVVVTAGDQTYATVIEPGVHALYFLGGADFDAVTISGLAPGVTLCTDDIVVGRPEPVTQEAP